MRISCTQENLAQGLSVVGNLANKSVTLPILSNVLIQVSDKKITLSSTNLEIGVRCVVRGKIETEGEITVQARLLGDYINLLPKERVDVSVEHNAESDDYTVAVSCDTYQTKIKAQPATDFPLIPVVEKKTPYRIQYQLFRQALSQVLFAVSTNETRPEITGVFFQFSDGLILAATDSYRLAEAKITLHQKPENASQHCIVPSRTLQELVRILGSFKDPAAIADVEYIDVYVTDNQIVFSFGDIELVSRLLDGQYPDYQQIIPKESAITATVLIPQLIKAVKTTSLFARTGMYDVSVAFDDAKGEAVLSSTNAQVGESTTRVPIEITGGSTSVVLNFRYLLDGLQNIDTNEVVMHLQDGNSPCILKPKDNSGYLYIIMPIRQ